MGRTGKISFVSELYKAGVWLDGETVEVMVEDGLVQVSHRGVLVATHAQRHRPAKESKALRRKAKESKPRPRQPTVGQSVTRKVDSSGGVSFAGFNYKVGKRHVRRQVQVAIVGETGMRPKVVPVAIGIGGCACMRERARLVFGSRVMSGGGVGCSSVSSR